MRTTNSNTLRMTVLALFTSGLAACAACGPGHIPEDAGKIRQSVIDRTCLPDEVGCNQPGDGGVGGVDGGTGGGTGGGGSQGSICPGWTAYAGKTPCLVETYSTFRADHYCEASGADPCAAVLVFYIQGGRCIGMERIEGESIPACAYP